MSQLLLLTTKLLKLNSLGIIIDHFAVGHLVNVRLFTLKRCRLKPSTVQYTIY